MNQKRILFIIQGEGRGHMTQAIALKDILEQAGHQLEHVIIGKSKRRTVPEFFLRRVNMPVSTVESPNFVTDKDNKSINLLKTITFNTKLLKNYIHSLKEIDQIIKEVRPDIIISFFELLTGLYSQFYQCDVPIVSIGHQYMFFHPSYEFPEGYFTDRQLTKLFTAVTSKGAEKRLALSYYSARDLPEKKIQVVPPLLRSALFEQPTDLEEDFLLIYLLNSGYGEDVIQWHNEHPDVMLHCFWDNREMEEVNTYDQNLNFHQLHDRKFLDMMARCKGLICTAGFESVSEAMYLNKPVFMIPTAGHFEQMANALDAMSVGAGIYDTGYDIGRFLRYIPTYQSNHQGFRAWVHEAPEIYLQVIEEVG